MVPSNALNSIARPPGVYFDFVSREPPATRRRSDVTGFVGFVNFQEMKAARRIEKPTDVSLAAVRCDSLRDFHGSFGSLPSSGFLDAAVRGFFENGGRTCYVAPAFKWRKDGPVETEPLVAAPPDRGDFECALDELAKIDAVSLIAAPDAALLESEEDRLAICGKLVGQAEQLGDRIALLDPPSRWIPKVKSSGIDWERSFPVSPSALAALYWPWLRVASDMLDPDGGGYTRAVPPSGHIAGMIAHRDLARGFFAPPANIALEGVVDVAAELEPDLRSSANEAGINVIVALPGRGIRAMGARTLSIPANLPTNSLKWLNVRRLFTHLCEWIAEDTQWTVFEPNSEVLWRAIERLVRTILFDLWRRGALTGATDDDAYFVRCDRTTNPPHETEQGRVICLIGVRPAGPAEMIYVRVGMAEGQVELLDREVPDA